jgi:hypothetical protein
MTTGCGNSLLSSLLTAAHFLRANIHFSTFVSAFNSWAYSNLFTPVLSGKFPFFENFPLRDSAGYGKISLEVEMRIYLLQ